jgi:hypothetical protein
MTTKSKGQRLNAKVRWLAALVVLTSAFSLQPSAFAGSFHCRWNFTEFTETPIGIKQVKLQTIAAYGTANSNIITGDFRMFQAGTNGSLTVSNLVNGRTYRVTFLGPNFQTVITNSFDTNVTGLVNAVDYIAAPINDGSTVAYSQTGADARFHNVSGDTSTNATFRGTLTMPATGVSNYVWTATNSTGAGFWAVATGGSGSGTFDFAALTNKPAPIHLVSTNDGSSLTNLNWNNIDQNMPAGFADGIDDTGAGGGVATLYTNGTAFASSATGLGLSNTVTITWSGYSNAAVGTLTADVAGNSIAGAQLNIDATAESEIEAVVDLQDLQGAVTDAQVPNTITIDLATTATTANAGDSATAFFSSGTIEHERGGPEADVSGYTDGLYGMLSGATADIDSISEFSTALGITGSPSSTTFLRGDGQWQTPAGSGDVTQAGQNNFTGSNNFAGSTRIAGPLLIHQTSNTITLSWTGPPRIFTTTNANFTTTVSGTARAGHTMSHVITNGAATPITNTLAFSAFSLAQTQAVAAVQIPAFGVVQLDFYYDGQDYWLTDFGPNNPNLVRWAVFTMPTDDGDAGEQLQTDGSGVLTWEAAGGAGSQTNIFGSFSNAFQIATINSSNMFQVKTTNDTLAFEINTNASAYFTGPVEIKGTSAGSLQLREPVATGSDYIGWKAPASVTTSYQFVPPAAVGSAGFMRAAATAASESAVTIIAETGSDNVVRSTSPTIATATITGAPSLTLANGTTGPGVLRIDEDDDNGANYAEFTVPALAANTIYTLPPDDGDAGEQLQTDGAGVLTWESGGGGAPTDADYLVGTANGSLSAEIVVGTSPGGELGGTWASPTLDDSVSVATWTITGAPSLTLANGTTAAGVLRIDEDDDNGANYAEFTVPALAANTVYTLPPDDGDAGEQLQTDGAGVLTWESGGGGAPTDVDYLVGTANGSLSAEIVVGTSPGGELGGTWASPTLDDSVSVATWTITGAPSLTLANGTTAAGVLRIDEDDDNGANYAEFTVPALAANTVYTLPPDDGDAGEQLQTDGAGVLTWEAAGSGSGAFSDASDPVVLNTATKDVRIGASGPATSKLAVNNDADQPALTIRANGTQTSSPEFAVFEKSDGTDILTVKNDGTVNVIGTTAGSLKLAEPSGTGTDFVGVLAPSSVTASYQLVLPGAIASAGFLRAGATASSESAVTVIGETGSGSVVRDTSPTLTTPAIGAATATTPSAGDNDTSVATTAFVRTEITTGVTNIYEFAIGDETTAITTGTAKVTWRAPHAMTVKDLRASLTTVSSSGIPTVDINEGGTTIISTKLTIDASEKTSTTAAAAFVLSDSAIADDAEITFDIDVAGTGATGLKVKIYYTR